MEDNLIDLQRKVKVLNDENNKMYKEIKEKDKEIERLNNIINEFEKYIRMHHTDEYANKLIKKIKGEDKE